MTWLSRNNRAIGIILLAGFLVRLIFASQASLPGIADSTHYYNLARNLSEGRGFVIDYIWQYHVPPEAVTHPTDYWMPLPALPPALALLLFPDSLLAALIPSVIIGTLVVALSYVISINLDKRYTVHIVTILGVVFSPQLVLNSARTDTTLLYVLFIGSACLAFYVGMNKNPRWLFAAGIFAALAYLSRQDAIFMLPAFVLALIIYRLLGEKLPWKWLILIPIGWLLVTMPWFVRNLNALGVISPSGAGRTLFMTEFIDQFTYGRTLDLDYYLDWGIGNIIGNILFQFMANIKTIYTLLDVFLPITAIFGLGLMIYKWDKKRLLAYILPFSFLAGILFSYSFITPFHTMGGSFYKSYQFMIPFMAYAGAYALVQITEPNRHYAIIVALLMSAFMLLNAYDAVRLDFGIASQFLRQNEILADALDTYGDVNDDGVITVMAQDPYIMNYLGYHALMLPSDPRDMILEAAYRYDVDYIILPAARPALDPLYDGQETDPRLRWLPVSEDYQLLEVLTVSD